MHTLRMTLPSDRLKSLPCLGFFFFISFGCGLENGAHTPEDDAQTIVLFADCPDRIQGNLLWESSEHHQKVLDSHYIEPVMAVFNHLPKTLQKAMCALDGIYLVSDASFLAEASRSEIYLHLSVFDHANGHDLNSYMSGLFFSFIEGWGTDLLGHFPWIDMSLDHGNYNPRLLAVLAHELGHIILHQDLKLLRDNVTLDYGQAFYDISWANDDYKGNFTMREHFCTQSDVGELSTCHQHSLAKVHTESLIESFLASDFVSPYGASNYHEDFAEFVTFAVLTDGFAMKSWIHNPQSDTRFSLDEGSRSPIYQEKLELVRIILEDHNNDLFPHILSGR
ncbi:MAG: hypothetical protein HRU19_05855 [Pseudobacteriovorax sp.]|nr:hypothetical protein [Pseudobacteriovorax sp.]